jgi:hypothetical protein
LCTMLAESAVKMMAKTKPVGFITLQCIKLASNSPHRRFNLCYVCFSHLFALQRENPQVNVSHLEENKSPFRLEVPSPMGKLQSDLFGF